VEALEETRVEVMTETAVAIEIVHKMQPASARESGGGG